MDELTKTRVNNLISLRQSLLVLLPILIGGTVGLIFIKEYPSVRIVLGIFGIYFIVILAHSLSRTITELNQILYKENAKCKM